MFQKIIVIGSPGAGKSTFVRKLRDLTGLPLFYLDMLWHKPDRTNVSREEFDEKLHEILMQEQWIIDGNYGSTMETRLNACDTVFFLDYNVEVCIAGVEERKGQPRSDMPWVESGATDEEFIDFVKNYNSECRPGVMSLLEKYSSKNSIIFTSREEADKYLLSFK